MAAVAFYAAARPSFDKNYGAYAATATLVAAVLAAAVVLPVVVPNAAAYVFCAGAAVFAVRHARQLRQRKKRARHGFERLLLFLFALAAAVAVFVTVGIVASVLFESVLFFRIIPVGDFLFGLHWSPQIAIREDQIGAQGAFGFIPLLAGTLLISAIAMAIAAPMGLLSAVYLSEFASPRTRALVKPVLEILAGVPTIVYGFFAVAILSPVLVDMGKGLNVGVAGENALAAGLVMGMMLIPFIASLSEDAFFAVPDSLRQAALGLGSTRYETTTLVVIPSALPGVAAGLLLAFSRAIGETMIVVMAAGASANLTMNPLEAVTTVTVQIVTLLTGDQTFDDPKTLAAFALGLALFVATLAFNVVALHIIRKYRERYE